MVKYSNGPASGAVRIVRAVRRCASMAVFPPRRGRETLSTRLTLVGDQFGRMRLQRRSRYNEAARLCGGMAAMGDELGAVEYVSALYVFWAMAIIGLAFILALISGSGVLLRRLFGRRAHSPDGLPRVAACWFTAMLAYMAVDAATESAGPGDYLRSILRSTVAMLIAFASGGLTLVLCRMVAALRGGRRRPDVTVKPARPAGRSL
jgi:hypothetical protein